MIATPLCDDLPSTSILPFEVPGTLVLRGVATSHPGWVEEINEDTFGYSRRSRLLVLADGVGAHGAGEFASQEAVRSMLSALSGLPAQSALRMSRWLEQAMRVTHGHLNELVEGLPRGRMGTTCLSVWCGEDHLTVGHVGDTRAYLLRGNELRCLTVDHRPAGERLRRGEIDWTTYLDEVSQGSLTRCMGAGVERFEMDLVECAVRPGDRLLLCTDGLTDSISERDLSRLLPQGEPLAAARALEDRALASGGRDNITIVVADFH